MLRQTVKQEPKGSPVSKQEPTEESLFGPPMNSMRSGEGIIPPLPLGTSDQTEMKPRGTFGRVRRKRMLVEAARLMILGTTMTGMGMMMTMVMRMIFRVVIY